MKYLLLLVPGLGDIPQPALGDCTPLEAADSPVLNRMAREGQVGTVKALPDGAAPSSLAAMLTILGYPPGPYLTGRGWFEALSAGAKLKEGEWVFRLQFITTKKGVLSDPRGSSPTEEEAQALLKAVSSACAPLGRRFVPGHLHSHLAIAKGDFSEIRTASPWEMLDQPVEGFHPEGRGASALIKLMETAAAAISGHRVNHARRAAGKPPINAVWPWGGGTRVEIPDFFKIFGKSAAMVSSSPLARGIGIATGMRLADPDSPDRHFLRDPSGRFASLKPSEQAPAADQDTSQPPPASDASQPADAPIKHDQAEPELETLDAGTPEKSGDDVASEPQAAADLSASESMDALERGFSEKLAVALNTMDDVDIVVVDLDVVRETSLEGDPTRKREIIEALDRLFISPLVEVADQEAMRIGLISSLSIDSTSHQNLHAASPFLIWGANVDSCESPVFNERVLGKNAPQIDQGVSFIDLFLSAS